MECIDKIVGVVIELNINNIVYIKDVFHPASYTVDHSLSGVQARAILRLRTRVM